MVLPKIRMQSLRGRLAQVRAGKGAAVMAPGVKRLALAFPRRNADGSMGPRKFWREYMPSLQFHNPDVRMDVQRLEDIKGPATLTIEFEGDKKEIINLKNREKHDIAAQVFELTKATRVPISEEDNKAILDFEEMKKKMKNKTANRAARIAHQKIEGKKMNISPLVQ